MTAAAAILLLMSVAARQPADHQQSVRAGREALDQSWDPYPWYDPQSDSLRPVKSSRSDTNKDRKDKNDQAEEEPVRPTRFGGPVQALAWLLLAAVLGALVYLLIRAWLQMDFRRKEKDKPADRRRSDDDRRRIEALPNPAAVEQSELLEAIRRYAEQGNFRDAMVLLFGYQLVQLDRHQYIRLARGKTNRQYLRELGRESPLHAMLEHSMVVFEDVFFGNYAIDRARFEPCFASIAQFDAILGGGTAA